MIRSQLRISQIRSKKVKFLKSTMVEVILSINIGNSCKCLQWTRTSLYAYLKNILHQLCQGKIISLTMKPSAKTINPHHLKSGSSSSRKTKIFTYLRLIFDYLLCLICTYCLSLYHYTSMLYFIHSNSLSLT